MVEILQTWDDVFSENIVIVGDDEDAGSNEVPSDARTGRAGNTKSEARNAVHRRREGGAPTAKQSANAASKDRKDAATSSENTEQYPPTMSDSPMASHSSDCSTPDGKIASTLNSS